MSERDMDTITTIEDCQRTGHQESVYTEGRRIRKISKHVLGKTYQDGRKVGSKNMAIGK